VDEANPVIELVKLPIPDPSNVLDDDSIVGDSLVLHTTPLLITYDPPSLEIIPPEMAELLPIEEALVDVSTAKLGAT
jgi:hypothetical protein